VSRVPAGRARRGLRPRTLLGAFFVLTAASAPRAEDLYIPNQGSNTVTIVDARNLADRRSAPIDAAAD